MMALNETPRDYFSQLAKRDWDLWAQQVASARLTVAERALEESGGDWETAKYRLRWYLAELSIDNGTDQQGRGVK